jgi:membrane-bound metal-dependent hydrolase YbcI (DUF457 family)
MFIGHLAVGFASQRVAPRASLGLLLAAPLLPDLLWPIFLFTGWEQVRIDPGNTAFTPLDFVSYPYSHSLAADAVWAALLALAYWWYRRDRTGAVVLAAGVLSHWICDAVTHRPDMPLYPGGPVVGLGLWNSVAGTILVEAVLFTLGVWLYATATSARDRVGRYAFWGLVALLLLMYAAAAQGQPPPSVTALAAVGLGAWLFPLWGWWLDHHRAVVTVRS